MRVLLLQIDGKLPNLALMRIASHHAADEIVFRRIGNFAPLEESMFDPLLSFDRVYASLIFERTRPLGQRLKSLCPHAVIGGTGWDLKLKLEDFGIKSQPDYSIYPRFPHSIGFTQRGCRMRCKFCVVPKKEGAVREENTIAEIWRGAGHPRNMLLLDNDIFWATQLASSH